MTSPIIALDHLRIDVADLSAAIDDYRLLLGTRENGRYDDHDEPWAVFETGNLALCLRQTSSTRGLKGLCFRVDDRERMRRRAKNLGLGLEADAVADPLHELHGGDGRGHLDRLSPEHARGLPISFVHRPDTQRPATADGVTGLDHVVIGSSDADGTALLLGARLGLDLRMDMSRPEWGARLLFFRCADLVVEVFQPLDRDAPGGEDNFYGLSWRVRDIDRVREHLASNGFDVSEVRTGRKPGTRVCTVGNRTADVATLLLQPPVQPPG